MPDRTQVACQRCHSKKVKCHSGGQLPCAGCISARVECILIDSQRGRYERRRRGRGNGANTLPRRDIVSPSVTVEQVHERPVDCHSLAPQCHHSESPRGSRESADAGGEHPDNNTSSAQPMAQESPWTSESVYSNPVSTGLSTDASALLYAQLAEQGVNEKPNSLFQTRRSTFLGEAFSLTYVINDVLAPFLSNSEDYEKRLHYPTSTEPLVSQQDLDSRIEAQTALLRDRGLLYVPSQALQQHLLDIYFKWFHPAYPIIDKNFVFVGDKCQSPLVLNAILMIAATICEPEVLVELNCKDRLTARKKFYDQSRALYDADYESDTISNICAAFLLSFWWSGPDDDKDSWHWLGIAISLAQSKGLHRSTRGSFPTHQTSVYWRKIWWCLQTRDVLVSGSIGRPRHVRDSDCDVEMLSIGDMQDEPEGQDSDAAQYIVQIAKLSTIFGNIIDSRYAAVPMRGSAKTRHVLENDLSIFIDDIPTSIQYKGVEKNGKGLWAAMLTLAIGYGQMLLCRPPRSITGEEETQEWGSTEMAIAAANRVTRVMEDILTASIGRLCQIHTIPALFNALSMHLLAMCTSRPTGRQLAENRARICMLGLETLQESWPVSGWVYHLFASIMLRLKSRGLTLSSRATLSYESIKAAKSMSAPEISSSVPSYTTSNDIAPPTTGVFEDHDLGSFDEHGTPNLFMFGNQLQNSLANQDNFFDLLNFPAWSEMPIDPYFLK